MDVDDPPTDSTLSLNHSGPHPESNTAEMEAAWTNCSQWAQVEDISDNDNSDSNSSESVELDSDTNLFSNDEDGDENERTCRYNFGDLGLGFQLRVAQAGASYTQTGV